MFPSQGLLTSLALLPIVAALRDCGRRRPKLNEHSRMQMRHLGRNGPLVSAVGLGCMGMSGGYGAADAVSGLFVTHIGVLWKLFLFARRVLVL